MNKEERLRVGKEVYDKKLTRYEAAEKYKVNPWTIRTYVREYKTTIGK